MLSHIAALTFMAMPLLGAKAPWLHDLPLSPAFVRILLKGDQGTALIRLADEFDGVRQQYSIAVLCILEAESQVMPALPSCLHLNITCAFGSIYRSITAAFLSASHHWRCM